MIRRDEAKQDFAGEETGLVDRSILAGREAEESRVSDEPEGGLWGLAEGACSRTTGAYGAARKGITRGRVASAASASAMAVGILMLGFTAPWSPLGPDGASVAHATSEAVGGSPARAEKTTAEKTTSTEKAGAETGKEKAEKGGGGFAPSVLPEAGAAEKGKEKGKETAKKEAEKGAEKGAEQLPDTSSGGSSSSGQPQGGTPMVAPDTGGMPAAAGYVKGAGMLLSSAGFVGLLAIAVRRISRTRLAFFAGRG